MRCDQKMKSNIFAQKNKPICGRFILNSIRAGFLLSFVIL